MTDQHHSHTVTTQQANPFRPNSLADYQPVPTAIRRFRSNPAELAGTVALLVAFMLCVGGALTTGHSPAAPCTVGECR